MLGFQGKTALITGGGTGIGLAIAKKFAKSGANIIILGRRAGPLEEAAQMLRGVIEGAGSGASVRTFANVDVADEKAVSGMFASLAGSDTTIDILVNNAGVSGPVTCFSNDSLAEFRDTVGIHLTGTFWMSREALGVMKKGCKIVTISTFFTEERPLEQRPYRFRDPYTASQGAKNRLAEAMSWELTERGIVSIATNPGPVHSDRIYKTVYPKAASEFMRVGGFEGLEPAQVEEAGKKIVHLLGEEPDAVKKGIRDAAGQIAGEGGDAEKMAGTLERLLSKIQGVAEKIQLNTSRMIADGQFLSQSQVAETVLALSGDEMARTLNGKVVPGDRVFYPVRGHIGNATPGVHQPDYTGRCILFTIDAADDADAERAEYLAAHIEKNGGKAVCIVSKGCPEKIRKMIGSKFHSHVADLGEPAEVDRWLAAASEKMGPIAAIVHMTGRVPETPDLVEMSRAEWDGLVDRFINTTAVVVQRAMEHIVPGGGRDPRLFKDKAGTIVVIGPDLPVGRKTSGAQRARVEVFRGALRPLTVTINQELDDVLKSRVRLFTVLPGRVDGGEPDNGRIAQAINYFTTPHAASSAEVVFCVDETRSA